MQIDWTTFVLEVLNFLVLMWILQHFLYRPVLAVLDARQERIRLESAQSRQAREEAEALKTQYEARLADWNKEREQARQQLAQELARERAARLEQLRSSLADQEARARAREQALAASREAALMLKATGEAYSAAATMLRRLASAALTARIADVFAEDLAALPEDQQGLLRNASGRLEGEAVEIVSAHPLDGVTRERVVVALRQSARRTFDAEFKEDAELIAGLRVAMGECLLHANLADELDFFRHGVGNA